MIKLIGLAGPARCGKSAAAKMLAAFLGYEQYALASPIKYMINALFGWDERHSEGGLKEIITEVSLNWKPFAEKWKELGLIHLLNVDMGQRPQFNGMIDVLFSDEEADDGPFISPRRAYQLFGTEFVRGLRRTAWLDIAKLRLDAVSEDSGLIITDIRFPNEHQWITQNGGFLVHIRRAGTQYYINGPDHASEEGLKTMAMDWQTPFCDNLEQLEANMSRISDFTKFAITSDVAISHRMPSFMDVYGDTANG